LRTQSSLPPVAAAPFSFVRSHGADIAVGSTGIEMALGGLLATTLAPVDALGGVKALVNRARTRRREAAWPKDTMVAWE